ncbi:Phage protein [uncultured Leptolyngbya sp.]|uniref:Phage protein n=1 Tax=uncultured Leptolyngbya sp. TaxID=332963 RepID=A0A6J4LGW1_9CYAN|nr:Phage protein [uncultured Leptolyngbya sp.]
MFQKATKQQSKLRLALSGPSGAGKTYSALNIAQHLGKTIALLDTEHGSASKYADRFDFDVCNLTDFHPAKYIDLIKAADKAEYEVIIIDSLSHAWFSELELAGKGFEGWKNVRPLERALIDAMLSSRAHVIATMRTKTEWVMEEYTSKQGKSCVAPKKVGTAPIQASGIEYELDVAGELNLEHILTISKSRCPALSGTTHLNPGEELAEALLAWLTDGAPLPESPQNKCERVKVAREAVGLETEVVKALMQQHYSRTTPGQLSSEQVDALVEMIASSQNGEH